MSDFEARTSEAAILEAIERMNKQDKKDVAHHIIDPIALFILGITSKRCMTVSDISPAVNLPIATCYKMVYQMEDLGLMAKCGSSRTSSRGKAATYTSVLKAMNLELRNGNLTLTAVWKNGQTMTFKRDLNTVGDLSSITCGCEKDVAPSPSLQSGLASETYELQPDASLLNKRCKVF